MPTYVDDGPIKIRKCTDVCFYAIFILFIIAMFGCSIYGYKYGQPQKLFAPLDSDGKHCKYNNVGNFCGFDPGYQNYQYLYIWDIANAVQSVDNVFDSGVCVT